MIFSKTHNFYPKPEQALNKEIYGTMSKLGTLLDRVAALCGYKVDIEPIGTEKYTLTLDSEKIGSVRAALYQLPRDMVCRQPLVASLPISKLWDIPPARFADGESHYLVRAIKAYEARGKVGCVESLREYYETFQPNNAANALGLSAGSEALLSASPLCCLPPWSPLILDEEALRRERHMEAEMRLHNLDGPYIERHGYKQFGPVSEELLNMEAMRLTSLYDSICTKGYREGDTIDLPVAEAISLGDKEAYVVHNGMHRVATVTALGFDRMMFKIPCFPFPVIRVEEAMWWPQVKRGLIDVVTAQEFAKDMILERDLCPNKP